MTPALSLLTPVGAASCLAASGVIHAQLYLHGYRTLRGAGPALLLQSSGACAVAPFPRSHRTVVNSTGATY
jgi:hypothetical protein